MSVVAFERKRIGGLWSEAELNTIAAALDLAIASGESRQWEVGKTEKGDPQLYLLGPLPDQVCEVCVSRIGRHYILEDGAGRLLFEHESLPLVAWHARDALRSVRGWLVARIVLLWCTIRDVIHDRVDPLLTQGEELLVHLTPLAAFV
jgi:hypothetical protein